MIESIKYETMECKYINFFCPIPWPIFVDVLVFWLKSDDPRDKELIDARIHTLNYEAMPKNLCEKLIREIRKLKKAQRFKVYVLEKITLALYPESNKKQTIEWQEIPSCLVKPIVCDNN